MLSLLNRLQLFIKLCQFSCKNGLELKASHQGLLDRIQQLKLVVAFAKCQQKKKNLPTSPVLVPMFIKPF